MKLPRLSYKRTALRRKTFFVPLLVCLLFAAQTHAQSLRRSAIVRAVQQASASVVNINGHKLVPSSDHYANGTKKVNGMGTGVVIDPRGYILTNFHVVDGVRRINVTTADKQAYVARLVARDAKTDLAIIKINPRITMPVIRIGSSHDIMTGETVIAMGNAYGYEHSVTTGIVSAQHRNVQVNDHQAYRDLIQTDASINPGNSGGPLLNIDGNMIGINVAVRVGAQGIGFAIPVDQGMQVAARLMSSERLSGVWHGVIYEDKLIQNEPTIVVRAVKPGSPAEEAGLRQGDRIRQVAGRRVDRGVDLECALIDTQAGDKVEFAVERQEKELGIELGIAASPKQTTRKPLARTLVTQKTDGGKLGATFEAVEKTEFQKRTTRFRGGLRVKTVDRQGLAASTGIRVGDILVGIHEWETISIDNLTYIIENADLSERENVPFFVVRGKKTLEGKFSVSDLR